MSKIKITFACLVLAVICMSIYAIKDLSIFSNRKVGPQPDGSILVPSNQLLRPAGFQVNIPGRPVDMVLTNDEKLLIIKNNDGLDLLRISDRKIIQSLPYKNGASSFTGICISGDGCRVYTANSGDRIYIVQMDADSMHWQAPILLPKPSIGGDPAPGGLALNDAGDKI